MEWTFKQLFLKMVYKITLFITSPQPSPGGEGGEY